mgnify:CR=1 FL=1
MEKNFRKNPHKDSLIVNGTELKNMTTPARIDFYSVSPPVGPSLEWKCKKEKKYAFEILSRWTKLDKINCFPCHLTSKLLGPRM